MDNIAPSLFGGLCLVQSVSPAIIKKVPISGEWWISIITPDIKMPTKEAREVLPKNLSTKLWSQQMANTTALTVAFATGDFELAKNSLIDLFAEPVRKKLIPNFDEIKQAALDNNALGCSISGGGPSIFALCKSQKEAQNILEKMESAAGELRCKHFCQVEARGVTVI